jgi:hypothetical protein
MRRSLLSLALFAVWWIGTGCDPPACRVCGATHWTTFASSNERFSVLMPVKPAASTLTANTAAGPLPADLFTAEPSKGYAFAVSHNSFPTEVDVTDTEALFDKIRKRTLSGDSRLISSRFLSLHGIPGRELKFEKKGQVLVSLRTYLIDHEAYQVYCVMPKAAVCQTHVNQFLDSFDLKQK